MRSILRDCLFLNWALPVDRLPEPPAPLRYQPHLWQGSSYTFASALLCHRDAPLPGSVHLGFPQLTLRYTVFDGDSVPALLCQQVVMPLWVVPGMRLLGAPAVTSARLSFPRPSRSVETDHWTWRVERGGELEIAARLSSPWAGEGPSLGSWEQTVRYFQERPRAYAREEDGGVRRLPVRTPSSAVWPLQVELSGEDLLARWLLPGGNGSNGHSPALPRLHSSWLCPEAPLAFAPGTVPALLRPQSIPQPAVGRVATLLETAAG